MNIRLALPIITFVAGAFAFAVFGDHIPVSGNHAMSAADCALIRGYCEACPERIDPSKSISELCAIMASVSSRITPSKGVHGLKFDDVVVEPAAHDPRESTVSVQVSGFQDRNIYLLMISDDGATQNIGLTCPGCLKISDNALSASLILQSVENLENANLDGPRRHKDFLLAVASAKPILALYNESLSKDDFRGLLLKELLQRDDVEMRGFFLALNQKI
jgi:hypothetical protein